MYSVMTLLRSIQGTGFHVTTTAVEEFAVTVTDEGGLDGATDACMHGGNYTDWVQSKWYPIINLRSMFIVDHCIH